MPFRALSCGQVHWEGGVAAIICQVPAVIIPKLIERPTGIAGRIRRECAPATCGWRPRVQRTVPPPHDLREGALTAVKPGGSDTQSAMGSLEAGNGGVTT